MRGPGPTTAVPMAAQANHWPHAVLALIAALTVAAVVPLGLLLVSLFSPRATRRRNMRLTLLGGPQTCCCGPGPRSCSDRGGPPRPPLLAGAGHITCMSSRFLRRHSAGTPDGGRFAADPHAETDLELEATDEYTSGEDLPFTRTRAQAAAAELADAAEDTIGAVRTALSRIRGKGPAPIVEPDPDGGIGSRYKTMPRDMGRRERRDAETAQKQAAARYAADLDYEASRLLELSEKGDYPLRPELLQPLRSAVARADDADSIARQLGRAPRRERAQLRERMSRERAAATQASHLALRSVLANHDPGARGGNPDDDPAIYLIPVEDVVARGQSLPPADRA